ncbi:MAG: Crp/Fnr family transcriptional regulator [Chlorobi bacterium]|nr:Crp/Fnr family transcriptional regulator [Chlorobiota bacterium]
MEDYISILYHCGLFNGISREDLYRLFLEINYRTTRYSRNEIIATEGYRIDQLMVVLKGNVIARMNDASGKVIRIEKISAPRLLAPAFLFASDNHLPVELVATDLVLLLIIPRESLTYLLQQEVRILKNYLRLISDRAQFLSNKIKFLSFPTIKGKLALYLLELSLEQKSNNFILPLSQSSLAKLFGVSRPALSRTLRELHHSKLIRLEKKEVVILDKQTLRSLTIK